MTKECNSPFMLQASGNIRKDLTGDTVTGKKKKGKKKNKNDLFSFTCHIVLQLQSYKPSQRS